MAPRTGEVSAMSASRTTAWYQSANRLRLMSRARCMEDSAKRRGLLARLAGPEQQISHHTGQSENGHQPGQGQGRGGGDEGAHRHGGEGAAAIEENTDQRRGHARGVSEIPQGKTRGGGVDRPDQGAIDEDPGHQTVQSAPAQNSEHK